MKKAFTLAEVLVTLGIIGVVAALTAPSLVMSSRDQANAAKLSVTVSNLEKAFNNAIIQEGAKDLRDTAMWSTFSTLSGGSSESTIAPFIGELGKYFYIANFKGQNMAAYYSEINDGPWQMLATGSKGEKMAARTFYGFPAETKSGATLFMHLTNSVRDLKPAIAAEYTSLGGSLLQSLGDIYIDVNGKQAPNTFGRDIFAFKLGADGMLHPYGGVNVSIRETKSRDNVWNKEGKYACMPEDSIMGTSAPVGIGCTARVMAEGKINY